MSPVGGRRAGAGLSGALEKDEEDDGEEKETAEEFLMPEDDGETAGRR